jgi:uncharacterized membrane protein (DUF4010 family)
MIPFLLPEDQGVASWNPNMTEVGILIAALGGMAVGLERQWSGHATGPEARFAGARTFTLLGILAGMAGWLWTQQYQALASVLMIGAIALVTVGYFSASRRDVDATTEVAALVVLAAGVAAGTGRWALAGGIITLTTLLLVEKSEIHELAQRLDSTSMRAAVRFGVMAIVILPLLPEGPYGPWGGIRPRTLWLMVLLFSGLSFVGYIARRALPGGSYGYPVAGILGGLISSTSVAFTFSRLSRSDSGQGVALALGVVGASTLLFLRVVAATAVLNPDLARIALPYFALPFALGTAIMVAGLRWNKEVPGPQTAITNPLQFWASLQMAALFQGVLYAVYWLGQTWGTKGLLVSGAVLGLTDMDALTISMARGEHGATAEVAAQALSIGILSNTALKAAVSLGMGAGRFRWFAAGGLAALGAALALSYLFVG